MIRDLSRLFALKARLRKPRPKPAAPSDRSAVMLLEAGRADGPRWDTEEPSTIPAHDCEPLPTVLLTAEAQAYRPGEQRIIVDGRVVRGVRRARIVMAPDEVPTLFLEVTDFAGKFGGAR
jgi:hypothetical protein